MKSLRIASYLDGLALLFLVLVAMPLKYAADMPLAVRISGMVHGVVFLWFLQSLLRCHWERAWSWKWSASLFAWSFVPFGFLRIDQLLQREATRPETTATETATDATA